jgi:hypothetical protein
VQLYQASSSSEGYKERNVVKSDRQTYKSSVRIFSARTFRRSGRLSEKPSEGHSRELTMEEVLSERNKPPYRDIGKYSQKAGNRYRKVHRSIKSLQERDVSISCMTGQILQRWSRVYSFSSTTCCTRRIGEIYNVYRLYFGENKSTYKSMLRYLYRC